MTLNPKKEEQAALGEELYQKLQAHGIEVLYDDRKERPGVKFADSDLIGIPLRVTVGKRAGEGIVEFKERATKEQLELETDQVIDQVKTFLGK